MCGSLLGLATMVLFACGGASDPKALVDEGQAALGRGDFGVAAQKLEAALGELETSDPQWMRAKTGFLQALATIQPNRATEEFLGFAEERGLGEEQYAVMIDALRDAEHYAQATEVGAKGLAAFGEQGDGGPMDQRLMDIAKLASEKNLPEVENELEGLGYGSND